MITRVVIAGGLGRMGQTLIELATVSPDFEVGGVTLAEGETPPPGLITDSGTASEAPGITWSQRVEEVLPLADVLIDFTSPDALIHHAKACAETHTAWVIGTTGLTPDQGQLIDEASRSVAVCQAANFCTGVNLMLRLVELASRAVALDTDLEVIEAHHKHKVDAPSGTALAVGEAMARGRGVKLEDRAVMSREGITSAREEGSIGFATIRGGDIFVEQTALFASEGELFEITHRAGSRLSFARGALRAAAWLTGQHAGRYDMQDVLQLRE